MSEITISTGHPDAGRIYAEALDRVTAERDALQLRLTAADVLFSAMTAPEYLLPGAYTTEVAEGEWFRWNGQHRPINKYHLCDVVLRDGRVLLDQSPYDFDWSYGGNVLAARQRGERSALKPVEAGGDEY